ncbi:hypothetical protein LEP1GSC192_3298 [Leptospira sp. B5-022]|nr:hypothetical protein LEP1GSC192_3298 [Leptospira sp. B5-022]
MYGEFSSGSYVPNIRGFQSRLSPLLDAINETPKADPVLLKNGNQ